MKISHTEENYLKALYSIENVKGEVTVNEISKKLNIKMPTVNSMIKRLSDKELVVYESYKPLKLTTNGKKLAALIIRKHRLTEMFLVEVMHFGWEKVHEIAEQVEHIKSPDFFDKMDEMLGYPIEDPHGSPIPNDEGVMPKQDYVKLSDCSINDEVVFKKVSSESKYLLDLLNNKQLELGMTIKVIGKETYDDSMTIAFSGVSHTLSSKVCQSLYMSKNSE